MDSGSQYFVTLARILRIF